MLALWFSSSLLSSCFLFFFLLVLLLVFLLICKSGTLETQMKSLSIDEALPLIWLGHFLVEVLMLVSLKLSFWDTQIPSLSMSCLEVLAATLGSFFLFLFFQLWSTCPVLWLFIKIILSHLDTIYIQETEITERQSYQALKRYLNKILH